MTIARLACLLFFLFPVLAFSESSSALIEELSLKNGMKICLKSTNYEDDEVVFELFAMGGYSALAKEDRSSAMIAPEIVLKSGLGEHEGDALTFNLYQHSIELDAKIQAFDRRIEGSSSSDSLEECFKTLALFFTQPKFDLAAFKFAIAKTSDSLKLKNEADLNSNEIFTKLNTQNWDVLNALTVADLDYANLYKAERLFRQSFSNPADFTLVLVGDFDTETIWPLLEKMLGSIPSKPASPFKSPSPPTFPLGITKLEKFGFQRCYNKLSITRLTFPISAKVQGTKELNLICQIIKNRLLPLLPQDNSCSKRLEVSYEFPFFPQLDTAWLIIQFSSSAPEIDPMSTSIVEVLKKLQTEGVSEEELERLQCSRGEKIEIEENTYLLSLLSNYCRANWAISQLSPQENTKKLEKVVIKKRLNEYFKLDQYSLISLHP